METTTFDGQQSDVMVGAAEAVLLLLESYRRLPKKDSLSFVDRTWTTSGSTAIDEIGAIRSEFWRDSSLDEL